MAHSPSPHSATLPGGFMGGRRLSLSPPPNMAPLSKRDKKRSAIENRLKEISTNFTMNRDVNLRNQLNALSRDILYINQADPYQDKPLDDSPDDLSFDMSGAPPSASVDGDSRAPLGKHAVQFVNDVNDAMEERDANLTKTHLLFTKSLDHLKMEYDFALEVAEAEEQALRDSARTRVVYGIQSKKRAIQKEKDLLDAADSNTLLYNSSGFTTTQPGSPGGGGLHNNRKTRHTRHHRQDSDGIEPAEATAAVGNNKRKRKAPTDFENGSPAPHVRTLGDLYASFWDGAKGNKGAGENHNGSSSSPEPIDRFFSAKDLAMNLRHANNLVAQSWSKRRPSTSLGDAIMANGVGITNGDPNDLSDGPRGRRRSHASASPPEPAALQAPAMERGGSYQTRSTRNLHPEPPTALTVPLAVRLESGGAEDPRRVFGAAVLDAHIARQRVPTTRDVEAPLSSGLSTEERAEDLQLIARLMADPAD